MKMENVKKCNARMIRFCCVLPSHFYMFKLLLALDWASLALTQCLSVGASQSPFHESGVIYIHIYTHEQLLDIF